MKLAFETIRFFKADTGVRGLLLKFFAFTIDKAALEEIGPYQVEDGALVFDAHEKKRTRAMHILREAMQNTLTCTVTKHPAIYIDEASGIPLIGALEFGIIDRGTNLVEIRPCSGCNLACVYCSVHEGPGGPKKREIVIQKEYLVSEFNKLAEIKKEGIEIFIETQGEPLLYADMPALIADLKAHPKVTQVTMVTNGTFLTEQKIDELAKAGLDRINWSLNALDPELAKEIAGVHYDVERIKKLIMYAKDKLDVLLCPVILNGINDHEMGDFVEFAKQVRKTVPIIGFQNFLYYKGGRNPVPELPMTDFDKRIHELEEKHNTRLKVTTDDFHIEYDETPPKPFKKKETIEVERLFPGRQKNETMCKAQGRIVKVIGRVPDKQHFAVQLIRDKHNIFLAKATA